MVFVCCVVRLAVDFRSNPLLFGFSLRGPVASRSDYCPNYLVFQDRIDVYAPLHCRSWLTVSSVPFAERVAQ